MINHSATEDPTNWVRQHLYVAGTPSEHILAPSLTLLQIARSHSELVKQSATGATIGQQIAALTYQHGHWQATWLVDDTGQWLAADGGHCS
jgi:hypothetical protein